MSEPDQSMGGVGGVAVAVSTEIMVAAVIFLMLAVLFVLFLYLYAKRNLTSGLRGSGARFVFVSDTLTDPIPGRGLDPAVLQALPVAVFQQADFKEGLECAVCLSEVSDGEKVRLLPSCKHGFHLECIDMWFHSHVTCPLCRSPVGPEPSGNPVPGAEPAATPTSGAFPAPESPVFPTNVLFWGTHDHVSGGRPHSAAGSQEGPSSSVGSSSRKKAAAAVGELVIQIPRRGADGFPSPLSPLPSSRPPTEEMKSPASARMRSLRRLWSRGKRTVASPCSPHGGDIEQGLGGGVGTSEGGGLASK